MLLASPKTLIGGLSDYDRDSLRIRQQPQNVFEKNDIIGPQPNHGVLLGQCGLIDPAHFDGRDQYRRCRKQVCPVLLDEASRGRTISDDQIGRSLRVERPEIFSKFGLRRVIATPSRDEGLFLNVQRPRRLSVQFTADLPAPCGPRLEFRTKLMQEQDFFRLSGSLA